jgi:hypothetical protein
MAKWIGLTTVMLVAVATPARAQVAAPQVAARPNADVGIRGKFSVMAAYGFDLDVFGELLTVDNGGFGDPLTRIVNIQKQIAYPDVYFSTPQRQMVSAGFGVFQRRELIVQYSRTENRAQTTTVGDVQTASGTRPLMGTFTTYKDESLEGGLRHYFKATGPSRKYVNLLFGRRKIEAISASMAGAGADADLGVLRLYDAATRPTAGIVFGITYERGLVGIYIEAGVRWTQRLVRQDDDLRVHGLEEMNNTGSRTFMPASIGIVFRK